MTGAFKASPQRLVRPPGLKAGSWHLRCGTLASLLGIRGGPANYEASRRDHRYLEKKDWLGYARNGLAVGQPSQPLEKEGTRQIGRETRHMVR